MDGQSLDATARPTAGLIGVFDTASFGSWLLPAIAEHELSQRIPDLVVRRYAPYGWDHPVAMDGGEVSEPLGPRTADRRAEVAGACDALILTGGDLVHLRDHLYAACYDRPVDDVVALAPSAWFVDGTGDAPVATVWNAVGVPYELDEETGPRVRRAAARLTYLAVRDERSAERLHAAGVDGPITVVPDPGLLVAQLFGQRVLDRRRRLHSTLGWAPAGRYIVVQGNGSMLEDVDRVSMAVEAALFDRPDVSVVAVDTTLVTEDRAFAAALKRRHPGPVWVASAPLLPVDLASLISGAEAFLGTSLHAASTAIAYGRPAVLLDATKSAPAAGVLAHLADRRMLIERIDQIPAALQRALAGQGPDAALAAARHEIGAHFDRIAEVIEQAAAHRDDPEGAVDRSARIRRLSDEVSALRAAHAVRGRRLTVERDTLGALLDDRDARIRTLEADADGRDRQIAEITDERDRLVAERAVLIAERDGLADEMSKLREAVERSAEERATMATQIEQLTHDVADSFAVRRDAEWTALQLRNELEAVYATRTMRWLRLPRRVYSWIRR